MLSCDMSIQVIGKARDCKQNQYKQCRHADSNMLTAHISTKGLRQICKQIDTGDNRNQYDAKHRQLIWKIHHCHPQS